MSLTEGIDHAEGNDAIGPAVRCGSSTVAFRSSSNSKSATSRAARLPLNMGNGVLAIGASRPQRQNSRSSRAFKPILGLLGVLAGAPTTASDELGGVVDDTAPGVSSQPQLDLDLAAAVLLVMRTSRRLANARLDREVQRFDLKVARDKFAPDFTIGGSQKFETQGGGWARDDTGATFSATLLLPTGGRLSLANVATGGGIGDANFNRMLNLRFAQPLLRGGGIAVNMASLRLAQTTERINALTFERVIGDVISSAVYAYRRLLRAGRRVEIGARSLRRAKDLLEINRYLIQAGRLAEREVVQAEADVAERELVLIGAENAREAARLALIDVLDIDSDTAIRPTDDLDVTPSRPALAESMELALANRPAYLQALLRIANAEAELLLAKNDKLWDLSATFSMQVAGADDSLSDAFADGFRAIPDNDLRLGVELSAPIGDVARKRRYASARAGLTRANTDLAELRQSIDIDVRNAVREVDVRLRQVELATRASELAALKLEAERQKLRLGLTTNFQMIRFEDDLVRTENSKLDATINYLNALTALDRTLGTTLRTWGITVESVERIDSAGRPAGNGSAR